MSAQASLLIRARIRRPHRNAGHGPPSAAPAAPTSVGLARVQQWLGEGGAAQSTVELRLRRTATQGQCKLAILKHVLPDVDAAALETALYVDLHQLPSKGLPAAPMSAAKLLSRRRRRGMGEEGESEEEMAGIDVAARSDPETLLRELFAFEPYSSTGSGGGSGAGGGGPGAVNDDQEGITEVLHLVACVGPAVVNGRGKRAERCTSCIDFELRYCVHCRCVLGSGCPNNGKRGHRGKGGACHGLCLVREAHCAGCKRASKAVEQGAEAGADKTAGGGAATAAGGAEPAASTSGQQLPQAKSDASDAGGRIPGAKQLRGCDVCKRSHERDWLPTEGMIRIKFDKQGRFIPFSGVDLQQLAPGVSPAALAQDVRDLGHLRCLGPADFPMEAGQFTALQELQVERAEGSHAALHEGWGVGGDHMNDKVVAVTTPDMVAALADAKEGFGTHVFELLPPAAAQAAPSFPPPPQYGSGGRLRPKYAVPGKRPIAYEPGLAPVIDPEFLYHVMYGHQQPAETLGASAGQGQGEGRRERRARPIMISFNFQHARIQLHRDSPLEGDGHGSVIITWCLRHRATIILHSLVTHLTYCFDVEPGAFWAMRGPIVFEEEGAVDPEDGDFPCSWTHGVWVQGLEKVDAKTGKRELYRHDASCRDCRISLNFRYIEDGSPLLALTREALAVMLGTAGGEEGEFEGGGGAGGGGNRKRGAAAGAGAKGKGKKARTR